MDFPVFRSKIISDISRGTEGDVKKEFSILLPIQSTGDLSDLGIFLVIL